MLIMLDGIDGSGKSTIMENWKKYLGEQGNAIFDLKKYWRQTGHYPELRELKSYDFIFSCEPAVGVGDVIRTELIRGDYDYPARALAEAYALDRLVLYTKIIVPLLREGRCIIQDRGVSTSMHYQPLSDKKLTTKFLSGLDGNRLALQYRPDHLILLDVDAKIVQKRLAQRRQKRDNAVFENTEFLRLATRRLHSPAFLNIFKKRGTKVHFLKADAKIDILNQQATQLLNSILRAN